MRPRSGRDTRARLHSPSSSNHPKWSSRAQVPLLASHSWPRTCALLVSRTDALPPSDVVPHIRADARRLYEYLHALFSQARDAREMRAEIDPGTSLRRHLGLISASSGQDAHAGAAYHPLLLELYASISPSQLLPFLRASSHYELKDALAVCEAHHLVDAQALR